MSDTHIWYHDFLGFLLDKDNLTVFIPDQSMSLTEQLNAALRFAIYSSIIIFVIKRDYRILFFPLVVATLTAGIYFNNTNSETQRRELFSKLNITEDRKQRKCMRPTSNNPFMNVLYTDYQDFPNRPPACNVGRAPVKHQIKHFFDENLYRDVDDVFHKKASDRQFYTAPITTIPNDQTSFAEWCYKAPKTCKEMSSRCIIGM
jgi:hypothetical protein